VNAAELMTTDQMLARFASRFAATFTGPRERRLPSAASTSAASTSAASISAAGGSAASISAGAMTVPAGVGPGAIGRVGAGAAQPRRLPQRERLPLARTITDEIVPLLVLAHRDPVAAASPAAVVAARGDGAMAAPAIGSLAALALASDVDGAVAFIAAMAAEGHALEMIYLDVVAGAARHLGQLWHDDAASFADVTIGVLTLRRVLHAFDHAFCDETARRDPMRRMLLIPCPGESHDFATDLVSAFLRKAGWDVSRAAPRSEATLCAMLAKERYAVLGISDSCGEGVEALGSLIRAARRASRTQTLRVMVGGPAFAADADLAMRVGADATARDARHAVTQAEGLLALTRRDG
jgi:methanogenic corrinoid protein MtbC1